MRKVKGVMLLLPLIVIVIAYILFIASKGGMWFLRILGGGIIIMGIILGSIWLFAKGIEYLRGR